VLVDRGAVACLRHDMTIAPFSKIQSALGEGCAEVSQQQPVLRLRGLNVLVGRYVCMTEPVLLGALPAIRDDTNVAGRLV
jgi:hypothetical protein